MITLESIKSRITNKKISSRKNHFRNDLINLSNIQMVQKYISCGDCLLYNQEDYFNLRHEIGQGLGIHPNTVLMVGSAKLGFSINPTQVYKSFDLNSDIDIAIVDDGLFDTIWKSAYVFSETKADWPEKNQFTKYLFKGWIRPEKLPRSKSFKVSSDIWDFFRKLTQSQKYGPFNISGALYKSLFYLESYQAQAIENCRTLEP